MQGKSILKKLLFRVLDKDKSLHKTLQLAGSPLLAPSSYYPTHIKEALRNQMILGLFNSQIMTSDPKHLWPHWVYKQLSPDSPEFNASPTALLLNSTHRNWTDIQSRSHTARVDTHGLVSPTLEGWSLDIWIANSQTILSPSKLKNVTQELHPDCPLIKTHFQLNDLNFTLETAMVHTTKGTVVLHRASVKNLSDKPLKLSLMLSICPFNPEGVSPIKDIVYLTSNAFVVNNKLGLVLDTPPDNILCLNRSESKAEHFFGKWEMITEAHCPDQLCTGIAEYRLNLKSGESKHFSAKLPMHSRHLLGLFEKYLAPKKQQNLNRKVQWIRGLLMEDLLEKLKEKSHQQTASLSKLSIGSEKENTLIQNAMTHIRFANSPPKLSTIHLHLTQQSVDLRMNNTSKAKDCLLNVMALLSQKKQRHLSSTHLAHFLICVYDYVSFTQDFETFKDKQAQLNVFYTTLKKTAKEILNNRNHFLAKKMIPSETFSSCQWTLAGLRATGKILTLLGQGFSASASDEVDSYLTLFLDDVLTKLGNGLYIENSRNFELDPPYIPDLLGLYPLELLESEDAVIRTLLSPIELSLYQNIHTRSGLQSGQGTLENLQLAFCYTTLQDPKAFSILSWISNLATGTGTWPEYINPISKGGMSGNGHSLWSNALYYLLCRRFLIADTPASLILTPHIHSTWLTNSSPYRPITFSGPTRFGHLSFKLYKKESVYCLEIDHKFHQKPKDLVIYLPIPIQEMVSEGKKTSVHQSRIQIPTEAQYIEFN